MKILGNVGAIASVLLEEYGHYIDAQINAIDSPGDEGELFADLVQGKALSQSELLGLWGEDDSAIVVWDGEGVSIEQQVQSDTLDFFVDEGNDNENNTQLPSVETKEHSIDIVDISESSKAPTDLKWLKIFDWVLNQKAKLVSEYKLGKITKAGFKYPVDINVELPNQVNNNQKFYLNPSFSSLNPNYSITPSKLEIPTYKAGIEYEAGPTGINNISEFQPLDETNVIRPPLIQNQAPIKNRIDLVEISWGIRIPNVEILGVALQAELPPKSLDKPTPAQVINVDGQLPSLQASQRSENFLGLEFDLDEILNNGINLEKNSKLFNVFSTSAGGRGFSGKFEIDWFDIKGKLGLAIQNDTILSPTKVGVTMLIDGQPEQTKYLGDSFDFTTPSEGSGVLEVKTRYELLGTATSDIGVIGQYIGELDALRYSSEASILGFGAKIRGSLLPGVPQTLPPSGNPITPTFHLVGANGIIPVPPQDISKIPGIELNDQDQNPQPDANKNLIIEKTYYIPYNMPVSISDVTVDEGNNPPPGEGKAYFKFSDKYYEWETYTVQPGDTLSQIALSRLGSASADAYNFIAFHNDIPNPDLIFANSQVIQVPKQVPEPDLTGYAVFDVTQSGTPNAPAKIKFNTADDTATAGSDYISTSGNLSVPAGGSGVILVPIVGDTAKEELPTENFTVVLTKQDGTPFAEGVDQIEATGTIIDNDDEPKLPEPNKNPREFNDPRYITIDGKSLEFQAAGEFTLLESLNDDYKIQIRQQPVGNDPLKNASNATAVATILGGKRVGLYQDSQQLLIDGVPTTIPDNEYIFVGEGRIYREGNRYSFVYPKGDQLIATMTQNRINVSLFLSPERRDTVRGIFGTYNDNPDDDLLKSDGTVLTSPISPEQLYGEYADSWRVGQTESLFDYQPGEDTNKFTISNYPRKKVKLSDLDPADIQKAEELIGDRITDPTIRETAIIDLVLTDFDPEVIEAAINVPSPQSSVIIRVDPEAKADFTSTFANTPVKINPLTNDIVTTGIALSLTGYDQTSAKGGTIQLDNNGTPDDKTDDQLTYTPPTNFIGIDTINYTIADDQKTATGTITVTVPAINLNALNGSNGFTVTGASGNFAGSSLSNIGDFNGDTIDDFIVGGFAADPNNINATGESYVVFGTNQGFPANFDLSTLNGTNGFIIEGFEAESFSGGAVSSAGDINGDGLKDLIIGAFASDSNSLNDSGRTYVILGSKQAFSTRFNLANLNGNNGFVINSNQPLDYSGLAVSSAGDFNNDGLDDLAVAAPAGINTFLGKVYLVYGRLNGFPPAFNPTDLQWDDGIVINHNNGLAGTTVSNAGDINGDQIDDLIIGAEQGSLEGNPKAGETYVLFGKDGGYQKGFSLSRLDGTNGFTIKGDGYSVSSVSGAGDINADGLEDIIIGVSQSPGNNQTNAGKAYVVFGTQAGFPQQLDLFTLNGNNGFVINGVEPDELLGGSVKGAGDINGDKIDDIIIGASGATANGIKSAGKTYIIFGSNKGFPASLNSSDLNGEKGFFLNGTAENELSGVAVSSAGDINKDSVNDILIGAPGSLFDNTAGKSYVVFGNSNFGNQAII
ncbi:MAG: VWD domain-containing protein [Planktothrix rubescens PR222]